MNIIGKGNLLPIGNTFANTNSREERFTMELISSINKLTKVPRNAPDTIIFSDRAVNEVFQETLDVLSNGQQIMGFEFNQFKFLYLSSANDLRLANIQSFRVSVTSQIYLFERGGNPNTPTGDYTVPIYYQIKMVNNFTTSDTEDLIWVKIGDLSWNNTTSEYSYTPINKLLDWKKTIPYRKSVFDSYYGEDIKDFSNTDVLNYNYTITAAQLDKLILGNYSFLMYNWGYDTNSLATVDKDHFNFNLYFASSYYPNTLFLNTIFMISGIFASFTPPTPYTV